MDAIVWISLSVLSCLLGLALLIWRICVAYRTAQLVEQLNSQRVASERVEVYTDSQGNVVRVRRVITTAPSDTQPRTRPQPPPPPPEHPQEAPMAPPQPADLDTPLLSNKL